MSAERRRAAADLPGASEEEEGEQRRGRACQRHPVVVAMEGVAVIAVHEGAGDERETCRVHKDSGALLAAEVREL